MTRRPEIPRIETTSPPVCGRCRGRRFVSWNPKLGPPPSLARAEYYVRVKGTSGLFRHLCRACQRETGDEILTRFVVTP